MFANLQHHRRLLAGSRASFCSRPARQRLGISSEAGFWNPDASPLEIAGGSRWQLVPPVIVLERSAASAAKTLPVPPARGESHVIPDAADTGIRWLLCSLWQARPTGPPLKIPLPWRSPGHRIRPRHWKPPRHCLHQLRHRWKTLRRRKFLCQLKLQRRCNFPAR